MKIKNILSNRRLILYFLVAASIVLVELTIFQIAWLFLHNYLIATTISFSLAVVLNWILGRKFVFGASHHHPVKEFVMVLIASIFGLLIQISVVFISVETLHLYPLIGKVLSIGFSFFWNYWFRAAIVYKMKPANPI